MQKKSPVYPESGDLFYSREVIRLYLGSVDIFLSDCFQLTEWYFFSLVVQNPPVQNLISSPRVVFVMRCLYDIGS